MSTSTTKDRIDENASGSESTTPPKMRHHKLALARTLTTEFEAAKARLLTVAQSRPEGDLEGAVPTMARILGWSEHNTRIMLFGLAKQSKMSTEEAAFALRGLKERVQSTIGSQDDSTLIRPVDRAVAWLQLASGESGAS
jgi:hypothetical protein